MTAEGTKQPNKRRTRWFAFRMRPSEREELRAAAEELEIWDSEFAREAIHNRAKEVLRRKRVK